MAETVDDISKMTPPEGMELNPFPGGFEDGKGPTIEQILSMLDGMQGIDESEKEEIRKSLLIRAMGGAQQMLGGGGAPGGRPVVGFPQYVVFLVMVSIILGIFVFFGYKLYKSLVDKEQKRLEKQKAKQQKKKK